MVKDIEIYNFEKRRKSCMKNLNLLSPQNKIDIERFCTNILSEGKSEATYYKYLERLPKVALLLDKDFADVTKEDLEKLFEKMLFEMRYSKNTIGGYKILIKRFYQWLLSYKRKHYPPLVDWIEAHTRHHKMVRPEDVLSGEDVQKLIAAAMNPRDRALIAVLAESGGRVSEVLTLKVKNVTFDNIGAIFVVKG